MEEFFTSPIRRYFDVELPRQSRGKKRWPLLIALHGYAGDKSSMLRLAKRIANGQMVVISLQGPNQFVLRGPFPRGARRGRRRAKDFRVGFGWGSTYKAAESHALHQLDLQTLIDLAVRRYHGDRRRVFLLGFSQACAYNYRFVFTHPSAVRGAIAVCGGVPGDWNENLRFKPALTHVLHIAATRDVWYSREKNLLFRRQLPRRAASLDFRFYDSTHKFPRAAIPHIRHWIQQHI